jgi:hypothetical protein
MKRALAVLALIAFLAPGHVALARGNHRFAIDQQWKRVEASQKRQNAQFRAMEREADRALNSINSSSEMSVGTGVIYPACGRQ